MKNFKKISVKLENGSVELAQGAKAMPRSLVIVNSETGAAYNVVAKCRNSDPVSIAKALAKAILAALKAKMESEDDEDMRVTKRRNYNELQSALRGHIVCLTNNNSELLPSAISLTNRVDKDGKRLTLAKVFKFSRSEEIFKLVVGKFDADKNFTPSTRGWDDPEVVKMLGHTVGAILKQMDWHEKLDAALLNAADSTHAEQEAEDKAAKKAKKSEGEAEKKAA